MNFDISGLSKTIWLLICLFIGLWSATDALHDKKAERRLAGRIFLSIAIVLVWVLIGLVTVSLAKVIAGFVGIFLIILLFYYFFNCR